MECDTQAGQFSSMIERHDINNLEGPLAFRNPTNDFRTVESHIRDWNLKWDREQATSPSFGCCVLAVTVGHLILCKSFKAAVIDESTDLIFDRASRAARTSLVLSAADTASSPQQIFACLRRLLADLASPVPRYRQIMRPLPFPKQHVAAHSKHGCCIP
jgi:hypothetical protein